jgi:lysophospholipase L1-like esterase
MTAPLSVPGARFGRSSLYIWNVRNLWGQVVAYLDGTRLRVPGGTWDHDGTLTPRGPVLLPTAPVSPLHAATKAYVDAAAGSAGGLASIERSQMSGRSGAGSNSNYAGGSLNFNVRLAMVASSEDDWSNVELLFGNFGQGLNADGPSDITLTLGIEYPAGQVMPVFWRAWQRSLTLIPGAVAGTVPMPASIPAGATWWLRIYGAVPTGGTWTQSWEVMQPAEGSGADFGTGVDKSLTGTIPTLFGWAPITPLAVLGKPAHGGAAAYGPRAGKRVKALAGLGDSIMEGLGDNVVSGGSGYRGWFPRGCTTAGMPWVRAARSGNRFIDFDTTTEQVRRCYSFVGCQAVVCNFATNDLNGGATLATLQSLAAALAATIKRMGLKYIPVTMTPRTNATNNGYYGSDDATKWQTRLDYNTWLRTNPFGDGIYDAAVVVEDPARPGYWLSAAPSDGLHPSEAQHTAIAADFASKIPTLLA